MASPRISPRLRASASGFWERLEMFPEATEERRDTRRKPSGRKRKTESMARSGAQLPTGRGVGVAGAEVLQEHQVFGIAAVDDGDPAGGGGG